MIPRSSVLVALLALPGVSAAAVLRVPGQFPTVQQAIQAASSGDTVEVAPGVYPENLDFLGKEIHLHAPEGAVLDGGEANPVIQLRNGEGAGAIIEGFAIRNGLGLVFVNATFGGGILCVGASPTIRGNTFEENRADFGAAVACLNGSSPLVVGNRFARNGGDDGAVSGGAFYAESASVPVIRENDFEENRSQLTGGAIALSMDADALIEDSRFAANSASGSFTGVGGAIAATLAAPAVIGCRFEANASTGSGGAIALEESSAWVTDCRFFDNESGVYGGAVRCLGASTPLIEESIFRGNRAGAGGGAIAAREGAAPTLRRCRLTANESAVVVGLGGGGIEVEGKVSVRLEDCVIARNKTAGSGAGVGFTSGVDATVLRCRIEENLAEAFGGGVFLRESTLRMESSRVVASTARNGAGLAAVQSELVVSSVLVAENEARISAGGALLDRATSTLVNTTFADNRAGTSGGGLQIVGASDGRRVINSILWANDAPQGAQIFDGAGDLTVSTSDVQGGWPGEGNLDVDPRFVQAPGGDFRLRFESPLIDVADPGAPEPAPLDFEGEPRVQDGDLEGTALPDVGADELNPVVASRFGTMNAAGGALADAFLLNGSAGDDRREVVVPTGVPLRLEAVPPPAGPDPARFVLYAYRELPDKTTVTVQPFGLGVATFPTPLNRSVPQQVAKIWNNLGFEHRLGTPNFPSTPAPSTVFDITVAFPARVTLQGFMEDAASAAEGPASLTNAIVLRVVEP